MIFQTGVFLIEKPGRLTQEVSNCSTVLKESGSSDIFIHFYSKRSIEWRYSLYSCCVNSKILQNISNSVRLRFFFRIAKRAIQYCRKYFNGMGKVHR